METIRQPITKELAAKVLAVVDQGFYSDFVLEMKLLKSDLPEPGALTLQAAVCSALGETGSKLPSCVSPEVRSFIKTLSNQCWGSDTGRIKGMRRIAIAQLGTAGTLDEQQFAENLSKLAITKLIPKVFRLMAETISEEPHKSKILEAARRCESEWTAEAALAASQAAEAAGELGSPISEAGSAAWSAMYSLKYDRVSAVIGSVAHAVYCATVAVVERHFHGFVGRSDADKTAAHADAMRDSELLLSEFTEAVVQILVEMKTPGSQFLFLTGAPGCGKNHFPETYCSHL